MAQFQVLLFDLEIFSLAFKTKPVSLEPLQNIIRYIWRAHDELFLLSISRTNIHSNKIRLHCV